jgi:hypothetical protein
MPVLDPQPPDLRILGDVELLAVEWLKAQAAIVAEVDARVYTALPHKPAFPAIRLFRVGGFLPIEQHLDVPRLQVEAFALSRYDARIVAATAQAALHAMTGVHAEGVVTAVLDGTGLTWSPDPPTNRPRYLFDVLVYIHPSPA